MSKTTIIREIMSLECIKYQHAKAILYLAGRDPELYMQVGPRGMKRAMSQTEARRIADRAIERIRLVDSTG
jgi:hypothetical protein